MNEQEFKEMLEFYKELYEEVEKQSGLSDAALSTEYGPPLATFKNLDQNDLKKADEWISKNLFEADRWSDHVSLELDVFGIPNYPLLTGKASFTSVKTAQGKGVFDEKNAETINIADEGFNPGTRQLRAPIIEVEDKDKDPVAAVKGKIVYRVPTSIKSFTLGVESIGKTFEDSGLKFKLVELKNNFIKVESYHKGKHPYIQAVDDTGRPLERYGNSDQPLYAGGKLLWELTFDKIPQGPHDLPPPEGFQYLVNVKGRITKAILAFPLEYATRTVEFTSNEGVTYKNAKEAKGTRYTLEPGFTPPTNLDLNILLTKMKIQSSRSEAMIGFNTPEVRIEFSGIPLKPFSEISFSKINVTSKGAPVAYREETGGDDIRFAHKDSEQVIDFDRVTGHVKLRVPVKFEQISIPSRKESDVSLSIEGNKIIVTRKQAGNGSLELRISNSDDGLLTAFDQTGMRLKRITGISESKSQKGVATEAYYFWGKPTKGTLYVPGAYVEIEGDFDFPAPPMRGNDRPKDFTPIEMTLKELKNLKTTLPEAAKSVKAEPQEKQASRSARIQPQTSAAKDPAARIAELTQKYQEGIAKVQATNLSPEEKTKKFTELATQFQKAVQDLYR